MSKAAQAKQAGALTAEPEGFAAARGYAALKEDIERRLSEARLPLAALKRKRKDYAEGFFMGEIAALEWLLKRAERREEAPHTAKLCERGEGT